MGFVSFVVQNDVKVQGPKEGLKLNLDFDEADLLNQMNTIVSKQLELCATITVQSSTDAHEKDTTDKRLSATPGNPVIHYWVDEGARSNGYAA